MVRISIAALIYKSKVYADFVYNQVHKYTPMLKTGEAEFYFVANDASTEVLEHLTVMKYPHFIQTNEMLTDDQLYKLGFGKPEYIHRVGWNRCITEASGDFVCLVNSDMGFSDSWLENLLKHANSTTAVSSLLIERGHETLGHFPDSLNGTGSIVYNCGKTPLTYSEDKFTEYVNLNKGTNLNKTSRGGVYMPILMPLKQVLYVDMYPEGNIAGRSFEDVIDYGDRVLMRKLENIGVKHITSWDSFSYHFQQGEMEF